MRATAKAHTNIALIKYWGKRNEAIILPTNNSLSLTLDGYYTTTTVEFDNSLSKDQFMLDEQTVFGEQYDRVTSFLDIIRQMAGKQVYAQVTSINEVPTAAGFASSASGFAALAAAGSKAIGLHLSDQELSRLTRRGSGSACRSIYGGFAEWEMGMREDGTDSYAVPIAPADYWDIRVAAVVLSATKKSVSSREGMRRTVETSAFFQGWLDSVAHDLAEIKQGIDVRDFQKVGEIAEANCLKMHATTLGAQPPFTYWHDTTLVVMQKIWEMRSRSIPVYFTIDAGPNVKVLYLPEHETHVQQTLRNIPGVTDVRLSKPGRGITYI
ncbi:MULTISPECIES: diphosphomevalonate decarboxylase [Virgibacillus]|uniref:diphosphomevalonate decarboxylase n=1 Tax=Virgibacillus pantothenticus TaxID=1473 RepID=A0A0L0QU77_VIRPA|nr:MULTISPECIES: diphosphomevalonate decarboxylase [Virgibacillus]API92492.1 diphosphomevalonate decarboxylase [Virgibacillus sp. 6R]KNE22240.1 diphosphomevalonate decarboxylase [Virgibacillus pantothenticus]MBS7427957.1 diphosphomevalonate decarboxylase [Virgibacillus sp. 19R1-5]MBU8568216.1 diphosphomevalonate decarboxylase [Virgibacillus pantothenticus]MBU8601858.1 diphosphomevalonate decarboxylase [Virgibacillus pantothenticus]